MALFKLINKFTETNAPAPEPTFEELQDNAVLALSSFRGVEIHERENPHFFVRKYMKGLLNTLEQQGAIDRNEIPTAGIKNSVKLDKEWGQPMIDVLNDIFAPEKWEGRGEIMRDVFRESVPNQIKKLRLFAGHIEEVGSDYYRLPSDIILANCARAISADIKRSSENESVTQNEFSKVVAPQENFDIAAASQSQHFLHVGDTADSPVVLH